MICCDEKTGMPVLSTPPRPNRPSPANVNDASLSTFATAPGVLINSLVGATGQIAWTLGATRKSPDFVAPLQPVSQRLPRMKCYRFDHHRSPHWSLEGCRLVARWYQGPSSPRSCPGRQSAGRFWVLRRTGTCVISPPNTAPGSSKQNASLASCSVAFLPAGALTVAEFDARWQRFLQDYNPATPMRTVGPIRATVGPRHAIQPDASPTISRSGLLQPASETVRTLFYPPRPYRRQAA